MGLDIWTGLLVTIHFILFICFCVSCGAGITNFKTFSQFSTTSMNVVNTLFVLPVVFSTLSLFLWMFVYKRKHRFQRMLLILLTGVSLIAFFICNIT